MGMEIRAAALILVTCALWGLVHSWLASLQAKQLARKLLGESVIERFYRIAYNIFAVLSFLPLLLLLSQLPDRLIYRIPLPWLWLTFAVQALAALFVAIGILQTGMLDFAGLRQLFKLPDRQSGELVTSGLYRYMRHPLYTGGLIFLWFAPGMSVNLLVLFIGLSAYLVIGAMFEERKLVRQFGQLYLDYRRVTPMFIPGLITTRHPAQKNKV